MKIKAMTIVNKPQAVKSNSSGLVMWREERLKDADGFLAGRLLGWFLQRDGLWLGSSFAMEYGKSKKYIHPSEVILAT